MENFLYIINNLVDIFNREDTKIMMFIFIIYISYFFFLMKNSKHKLQKTSNTKLYFYTLLLLCFFASMFFIFTILNVYIKNKYELLLTVYSSNLFVLFLYFLVFYFVYILYKVNKKEKRKVKAKQEILNFKVVPQNLKSINHKMMNDIPPFFKMKNGKKVILKNYKTPKLHIINKDMTYFQKSLLSYLLKISEEKKIINRYFEIEILRLIDKITDLKKDLIIGQFRSIVKNEADEEIIGAIYNLREKSISLEGYAYYITYINYKKDLEKYKEKIEEEITK